MRKKNSYLIPKADFLSLMKEAAQNSDSKEGHIQLFTELSSHILADWDGVSWSFLDTVTPGQYAVVCTADLLGYCKRQDFLGFITLCPELASRTFKALEILKADEYLKLLRQVQGILPNGQFPEYAEDVMAAIMKTPLSCFEAAGSQILTGKGMKRPLHEYVFKYIKAHPEDFCKD